MSAKFVFSSKLTLQNLTLPSNSSDNFCRIGNIALHGGHHVAQKSRTTGKLELITSSLKFASLTVIICYFSNIFKMVCIDSLVGDTIFKPFIFYTNSFKCVFT